MKVRIAISSGHGLYVRGASGVLDEVDEARRVTDGVAELLKKRGVEVKVFHDNTSTSQNENLKTIVDWHNKQDRDLDASTHFNAFEQREGPVGTEVWYVTQEALAAEMSAAIASCGFINRGAKRTTDLFFLNNTEKPAILLEICFVDSEADARLYEAKVYDICRAIADELGGEPLDGIAEAPAPLFRASGKCSSFGGPDDTGVSPSEGLAFISAWTDAPHLFLPYQPEGTTGLARRLNPYIHYVACRWDYNVTPKAMMLDEVALVRAGGIEMTAFPADWGPNENTGRVADLSPGLLADLGLKTDDDVEVVFPYRGRQ